MAQNHFLDFSSQRNPFKYSVFAILLVLIIAQFAFMHFNVKIISEFISLGVAFVCIFYLWLAERRDFDILHGINKELKVMQEELKISHVDTVLSLVLSQEAKDSYTYGHSERVRHYSVVIAQNLNLTPAQIEIISRGAKLHDIGKIGIKDEILFNKGKLTDEQFQEIKSHPLKGLMILGPLRFLEDEKSIVRHHHERFDGRGYPDGLKGAAIPLGARIVCVADAFDAMRSLRPYRAPLTREQIIEQLKTNAGSQFDPQVVEALLKSVNELLS